MNIEDIMNLNGAQIAKLYSAKRVVLDKDWRKSPLHASDRSNPTPLDRIVADRSSTWCLGDFDYLRPENGEYRLLTVVIEGKYIPPGSLKLEHLADIGSIGGVLAMNAKKDSILAQYNRMKEPATQQEAPSMTPKPQKTAYKPVARY